MWKDDVDTVEILRRLMVNDEFAAHHSFALYADKVMYLLPDLQDEIWGHILKNQATLPMFCVLSLDEMPFDEYPDVGSIESDFIYPTRHITKYTGDCPALEEAYEKFLEGYAEPKGHVIIYHEGHPCFVMEFLYGSVLALQNIVGHDDRMPVVIGGVYGVQEEIRELADRARSDDWFGKIEVEDMAVFPVRFIYDGPGDSYFDVMVERLEGVRGGF